MTKESSKDDEETKKTKDGIPVREPSKWERMSTDSLEKSEWFLMMRNPEIYYPHARKCQSESKNQIDKGLEDTTLWIFAKRKPS